MTAKRWRWRVAVLAALTMLGSAGASAGEYSIHAEAWARPRSGDALLALPALREAMADFTRTDGAVIEIRYPGGEEGVLWARELQDWLVALGVPSDHIRTVAGSGIQDSVHLVIERRE